MASCANKEVNMIRRLAGLVAFATCAGLAQNAAPAPAFEVASVKRVPGTTPNRPLRTTPDGVSALLPLGAFIQWAYASGPQESHMEEIIAPDWVRQRDQALYDIQSKTSGPASVSQIRLMMRTLLADRLKLVVHPESNVVPVLAMVVGKEGPKMSRAASVGDGIGCKPGGSNDMIYRYEGCTMAQFAADLDRMTRTSDQPPHIVDQTGMEGPFDITFNLQQYLERDASGDLVRNDRGLVDMVTMIKRGLPALGLRLESARAPVEALVVDHIEKEPIAN
jgi:uncharacterized protein (TIGR03435 family)